MSFCKTNLVGDYKWKEYPRDFLGGGSFGKVFTFTGSPHAFKIFDGGDRSDRNLKRTFAKKLQTIRALKEINHQNVVRIIAASILKKPGVRVDIYNMCLVMELCNTNLANYLMTNGSMDICQLRRFAIHITSGLSALRDEFVYPVDLKPQNILYGKDRNFKIGDLEDAKWDPHMISKRAGTTTIQGTPSYMSPELKEAIEAMNSRLSKDLFPLINKEKCNMYSLSLIFFVCLHAPTIDNYVPDRKEVDEFLANGNPVLEYQELLKLMKKMIAKESGQRATLNQVCFSSFFLKAVLPQNVTILGSVEHYNQHSDALKTSQDDFSKIFPFKNKPHNQYVLSYKDEIVCLRSDEAIGYTHIDRINDFLENNNGFNKETTKLFVFTGSHGKNTELSKGYNESGLTNVELIDEEILKDDRDALNNHLRVKCNFIVVDLKDYTGQYSKFGKRLEEENLGEYDILVPSQCFSTNSDLLRIIQSYRNQRELCNVLNEAANGKKFNVVEISGSILERFYREEKFPWELEDGTWLASGVKLERVDVKTVRLHFENFVSELGRIKNLSPDFVLMSFAVSGDVSLTTYLDSLKSDIDGCAGFQFVLSNDDESTDRVKIYQVVHGDHTLPLKYHVALCFMDDNEEFRSGLTKALNDCGFVSYTWEVVPTSQSLVDKTEFKFAVVKSSSLDRHRVDFDTFSEYFTRSENDYVTSFYNLGKDAMLIAPLPGEPRQDFAHIGRFLKTAPTQQIHAFWKEVSCMMKKQLSEKQGSPLWLSTAGHCVAWLNVRVDTYPKYYAHVPFTEPPQPQLQEELSEQAQVSSAKSGMFSASSETFSNIRSTASHSLDKFSREVCKKGKECVRINK